MKSRNLFKQVCKCILATRSAFVCKNEGTITELVQVPYLTKRGKRYEPFYLVQYPTAHEIIQHGLKPQVGFSVGRKVKVKYSTIHPTIFKLE